MIRDDNHIYLTGRKDNMIITGGENVNPEEIEAVIMQIPGVLDCAVIGLPDEKWGRKIVACIVTENSMGTAMKPITDSQSDSIKIKLKTTMTDYKIPREIFRSDSIPRNIMGKIDTAGLLKLIRSG